MIANSPLTRSWLSKPPPSTSAATNFGHFPSPFQIGKISPHATCNGLPLAGFHGGTALSLLGWSVLAFFGGAIGGLLLAPSNRFAGLVGGAIAGPMGLVAVYFYAKDRQTIHTAETFIVMLIASIPGFGIYWLLRLVGNAMFPPAEPRDDYDDEDDRPRGKRRRDDEDDEDDDGPRSKRRDRDHEDDDDDRPRRKKRGKDDEDDEDDEESPRNRRRRDLDLDD